MQLNGLESFPPKRPGLLQRLLRRSLKENAVIEVTNLFAENPIAVVSMPTVAEILRRYDVGFSECQPQFLEILRRVLVHLARDRELSAEDHQNLAHLQVVLELADEEVTRVREEVLADIYATTLADALADGRISPEERKRLNVVAESFGLPENRTSDIYKAQALKLLQWTFDQFVTDGRITATEEAQLKGMAQNLGVTLTHEAQTQALVDKFRLLGRIEAGDLPVITPEVKLQRAELCHATLACTHNEIRQQTHSYRYSGPTASIKIMKGVRWRIGQVAVQRLTRDVMTQLDSGTLYVTSKRLLFDGAKRNTSINFSKIVRFTVYVDGLKIEKDTGRDQYFLGEGELEVLGAVLDRLLTASR